MRWKIHGDVTYEPNAKETTLLRKECKLCQEPIYKKFLCKIHYDETKSKCNKCSGIVYRGQLCKTHWFEQKSKSESARPNGYHECRPSQRLSITLPEDVKTFVGRLKDNCTELARRRRRKGRIEAGQVTLTLNDIALKFLAQNLRCHWSGMEFIFIREHLRCPTLDRLDPEKGYTPENTVLACRWANLARNDASVEETLELFRLIKAA